ncbi:MAG: hypothetical protein AAGE59_07100 [Cyanobacteria bacterium P01_F01_bin.86]
MNFKAGTLPWLLRYEIWLWWREFRGKWFVITLSILLGLLMIVPLILWLSLFSVYGEAPQLKLLNPLPDAVLWWTVAAWLFLFFIAFIQAIGQSLIALFDRGDLDLLIASPVSSKVIFASRLIGVALKVFLGISAFIVLPSLIAVATGFVRLLGIYPALMGLCLMATSLAMLVTLWLVHLVGARNARIWSQVLASLLWAAFFIVTQLPNLLGHENIGSSNIWRSLTTSLAQNPVFSANSWIWFPAKAIFLEPISVVLMLLTSGAFVWLTVELLHRTFVSGTQQSLTLKRRKLNVVSKTRFNSNLSRVVLLKEWRVIGRNPYLISRTFLSILLLIPLTIMVLRGDGREAIGGLSTTFATTGPVMSISLTAQLALICLAGEEAPDLLRSSPTQGTALRRLKVLAVLIPVWLLLSPLLVILMIRGEPWLPTCAILIGATTCQALLSLWNARPISLANILKRQRQNINSDPVLGWLSFISLFAWSFLGFQVGQENFTVAFASLGLIVVLMLIAYWRSRVLGSSLGF